MWFDRDESEERPRQKGPPLQRQQGSAEQGRDEETRLPMAQRDEDCRKGGAPEQREGRLQPAPEHGEIERQGGALPNEEGGQIGQARQGAGDGQKKGRVIPGKNGGLRAKQRLLAGDEGSEIIGRGGRPVGDHDAGRIEAREIGSERAVVPVQEAVQCQEEARQGDGVGEDQQDGIAPDPLPGDPRAHPQLKPHGISQKSVFNSKAIARASPALHRKSA